MFWFSVMFWNVIVWNSCLWADSKRLDFSADLLTFLDLGFNCQKEKKEKKKNACKMQLGVVDNIAFMLYKFILLTAQMGEGSKEK